MLNYLQTVRVYRNQNRVILLPTMHSTAAMLHTAHG
jgi:hypothetical protein